MRRKIGLLTLTSILVSSAYSSIALAGHENSEGVNQALTYFCSKKEVNTQQSISIGKSTKVNLINGPFNQLSSPSNYQATLDLIADDLVDIGVNPECAEYLMTHTRLQGYEQGNVMARVYFDFNKYHLTDESKHILNVVANVVKQNPTNLILEGHTDNIGSKDYNFALGLKRSEAAYKYLLAKGVDGKSFEMVSKGEGEPIANNKMAEGRAKNRRVDVVDESPLE